MVGACFPVSSLLINVMKWLPISSHRRENMPVLWNYSNFLKIKLSISMLPLTNGYFNDFLLSSLIDLYHAANIFVEPLNFTNECINHQHKYLVYLIISQMALTHLNYLNILLTIIWDFNENVILCDSTQAKN